MNLFWKVVFDQMNKHINWAYLYDDEGDHTSARAAEVVREPVPQFRQTALRDKFTQLEAAFRCIHVDV